MEPFHQVMNSNCDIQIGDQTQINANVLLGPACNTVKIGFGCFIGRDVYIDLDELIIGDYTSIHHGSVIHGVRTHIGHNCWFGHYTIIDSLGGYTRIGNNVGIGAHSQLWSHMKFGDVLAGCRWHSSGEIVLDDDVWLVGHSIIGPIHAAARAMLLTGGVAVKNMQANHIYAGNPARDVTDKFGKQFSEKSMEKKVTEFEELKYQFFKQTGIDTRQFKQTNSFYRTESQTLFNLSRRTYVPRYTRDEYLFMKFLLYDKAKFTPVTELQKIPHGRNDRFQL